VAALERLVEQIGVPISNIALLRSALTHSSFLNENPAERDLVSGERLEFLGDAILNYLAGVLVFERFPERGEGDLSELRAGLVRTTTLATFARQLDLGRYVRLTRGEEASGARTRPALLADLFEAVIAAIYLDQGVDAVRQVMAPLWEQQLASVNMQLLRHDYRSVLQERIQAERGITPRYSMVAETGPDHRREYTIEVLIGDQRMGLGQGHSKQAAAQAAAQAALQALDTR
jgi:ribonuclease III